jgi:L-lysine exporter family protein LysE/ArgO
LTAAFLHGFVLAFGLIIPLGPQNVFVFSQGATQPTFRRALPVVAAAAASDTLLILLAVLGVSAAVLAVPALKLVLVALGFTFLLYAGWIAWRTQPEGADDEHAGLSLRRRVLLALAFSLLNPHAILDTIGVIGTSSLAYAGGARSAYACACIGVSWVWFAGLALAGRGLESVTHLRRVLGRVSAVAMWASAAYLGWMAVAGPLSAR